MKKLIAFTLLLTTFYLISQIAGTRRPQPNELDQLVGVTNNLQNELWQRMVHSVAVVTTNYTISGTNDSTVIIRNPVAFLNVITLPDCTNNVGRSYIIMTLGAVNTAVLTNANTQGFEGATNVVATSYTMSSNWVVRAIATPTNWIVMRLQNGNN